MVKSQLDKNECDVINTFRNVLFFSFWRYMLTDVRRSSAMHRILSWAEDCASLT
jgi:hypothetical protein